MSVRRLDIFCLLIWAVGCCNMWAQVCSPVASFLKGDIVLLLEGFSRLMPFQLPLSFEILP